VYDFEEREDIIHQTVERLLAAARIKDPPVSPQRIARALRINVLDRDLPKRRGQSYRYRGMKFVDIGKGDRTERSNFALAHEIMELELPETITDKQERHEIAARGTAALLCPKRFFSEAIEPGEFDLFGLKTRFSTASHEVIALRSLDFSEAIISVFDNGRLVNRQTSYSFGAQRVSPFERELMKHVMASGEVERDVWDGVSAIAHPVFEDDFKRVILRTVLD